MGLVKKYHQKIVSFGFILLSICFVLAFFLTKPQKTNVTEVYKHTGDPTLSSIALPYSIKIPALPSKVDYLTLHFGDDSLNEHNYKITVSADSDTLFTHDYQDEASNIVVLPLDATKNYENKNIEINITCEDKCKDVKMDLYETDTGQWPKIFTSSTTSDYRYLWFASFSLIFGLTLLLLSKETKK